MKLTRGLSFNFLLRGAMAGVIATLPMTVVMNLIRSQLSKTDKRRSLPPEEMVANVVRPSGGMNLEKEMAVDLPHYLYGAASGLAFAATLGRSRLKPVIGGPLFGLVIWFSSYLGWMPTLSSRPSAMNQSRSRNLMMIAAHLTWGLAAGRLIQRPVAQLVSDALLGVKGKSRGARMMQSLMA